ncbi:MULTISPECIES: ureidoglycolate lyase [unclassified Coleofasciculus]|uniref:ureidoglycolate lyase n=1 Tax=unclassified Coleofasciculus TaxID=2692782 RepID=UPI00187F3E0E|nr:MULTISPECIES: ureidoglycolate lyase [unclassified Coleofasciculus]MBE9125294.1 ureidoglycolate lyase [Coleofasciculus sp. LEGE 07081]MBE9147075.1 ureidoglycolate lyase [Coleofasciculus sp. LEGE 07092]
MSQTVSVKQLPAQWITSENFQPYGQLITPSADDKPYDASDAQLNLQNGIPRFYIMRLHQRGRKFHKITRHVQCTQSLGSLEGKDWCIAVAPPSESKQPAIEQIRAFRIPGNCFIKLEVGTWHAGPYFEHDVVNFYNLELSDTNEIDHFTHDFLKSHNLEFEIV